MSDNGIGMSRQEVIEHIGTIAKSGTREFFSKLGDSAKDAQLIGQFGVGFYSAFIVAEEVTLLTRRAGLAPDEGCGGRAAARANTASRREHRDTHGTDVILRLRRRRTTSCCPGMRLRSILRKYSDHITVPDPDEDGAVGRGREGAGGDRARTSRSTRRPRCGPGPKSEITEEQYQEFYKHVSHDFEAPLAYSHARVEGRHEYTQLLFIPQRAPFDLWNRDIAARDQAVHPPRVRDGRRRAADAGVPALRARDHRLERPAAQRLARDPAGLRRRRADPERVGQARARHARRPRRQSRREVRDVLEGVRPRLQGRRGRGSGEQGPDRQAAAVRHHARATARSRPSRWPTTSGG